MKKRITKHAGGLRPDKYLADWQLKWLLDHVAAKAARGGFRAAVNLMLVELILATGLRAAEVCGLTLRDLPGYHGKDQVFVQCGKGRKERTVVVCSRLAERLKWFIKNYHKGARPGSHLFVSERGGPMLYDSLYSKISILGRAAGIGRLTPHMLRHTNLTRIYNHNDQHDIRFVQDQAGHADPRTTAIYTRTEDASRTRQMEAVSADFFSNFQENVGKRASC